MGKSKSNLKEIAVTALFTAVICVFAQLSVPTPWGVPYTLQTVAIAFAGYLLGIKKGVSAVAAYILLGLIGVPVFANFKGGPQVLFGLTGGFIYGFIFLAFFCALAKRKSRKHVKIILGILGLLICNICGTVHLAVISKTSLLSAFLVASLPYILKDVLLIFVSFYLAEAVNKRFNI